MAVGALWLAALGGPTGSTVVPLDHGFLGETVNARLAGRPVRLIVDTGASETAIDRSRRSNASTMLTACSAPSG
jgi:hypothetical protein